MTNKYKYATTKKGKDILISSVKDVSVVSSHYDFPHWGWAVLWLLLLWPVLFIWLILGFVRTKYSVEIDYNDGTRGVAVFSQDEIDKLLAMIKD